MATNLPRSSRSKQYANRGSFTITEVRSPKLNDIGKQTSRIVNLSQTVSSPCPPPRRGKESGQKRVLSPTTELQNSTKRLNMGEEIHSSEQKMTDIINKALEPVLKRLDNLDTVKLKVDNVCAKIDEVSKKVDAMEESVKHTSAQYDEIRVELQNMKKNVNNDLKPIVYRVQAEHATLKETVDEAQKDILDLQTRAMRDNLLFFNIPEKKGENCTECVLQLAEKYLKIEDASDIIKIDRAHRIGANQDKHRPIVAKFHNFAHRELIRKSAHKLKDESESRAFGIAEQFPSEIVKRRKILLEIKKELHLAGKKSTMSVDKLYMDGHLVKDARIYWV